MDTTFLIALGALLTLLNPIFAALLDYLKQLRQVERDEKKMVMDVLYRDYLRKTHEAEDCESKLSLADEMIVSLQQRIRELELLIGGPIGRVQEK